MNCILIFDNLNDVLFAKYDREFSSHLQKLGSLQGLIATIGHDDIFPDGSLNTNMLIQLFSPVVTSQRIMSTQFGNSYTSVQCLNGTNIVFDEYMGFLFICVGPDPVVSLQHRLCVFISLAKHVCGPDICELKCNARSRSLLSRLFDSWNDLHANDQACLVEAVEQLTVNPDVTAAAIKTLQGACNSLRSTQSAFDCSKSHALIFVENKLLALYSSREAEDLSPSDILFLNILSSIYRSSKGQSNHIGCTPDFSPNIPDVSINSPDLADSDDAEYINKMNSEVVLLKGKKVLVPHAVHMANFGNGVTFMLLHQICHENICIGFDEVFSCLATFNKLVGADTEVESQKKVFEGLEIGMKKVVDCLKKVKNKQDIEPVSKQLQSKWDAIKKKYYDCVKNNEDVGITLSAANVNLLITLRQIFQGICLLSVIELPINYELILKILQQAQKSLVDFNDFLKAKVHHNFTLNSRSLLTINKYLEEFPGLVHFIYIDRINHRVTAPFLNFSFDETNVLALRKIWEMVDLSRNHIREGQLAFLWKDTTFNYAYFLWFEDQTGTPLKPKIAPGNIVRSLPMPGILAGDFYRSLICECFPKMSGKVRCFELYCIHLGLANSSIVLDQSRRIAATVSEVSVQGSTDCNFSSSSKDVK